MWRSQFGKLFPALAAGAGILLASASHAQTLREAAAKFPGLRVGAAIKSSRLDEAGYANTVRHEFNMPSPENDTKWNPLRPTQAEFAWAGADANASFARAAGEQIRGHTLQWYKSNPAWLTGGGFSTTEARDILFNHIDTVSAHYQDDVFAWDVVNEAFNDNGSLRDGFWYNAPGIGYAAEGTRYIEETFIRAAAADPGALLIYNDYGAEEVNAKSDAIHAMAQDFLSRGVPLDGIGFQMHIPGIDYTSLRANFKRFNDLGLDLHITEMDVRVPVDENGDATPADLESQADIYWNVMSVALGQPRFTVLQTWGFTDNDSWIPGFFPGTGAALLFDETYQRKPAYWAVWNALANQAEKLAVLDFSDGDSTGVFTSQETLSAGAARQLLADAPGDFMTLEMPVPTAGQWNVRIGYRKSGASGQFQLAVAPEGAATFTEVGGVVDAYTGGTGTGMTDLGDFDFPSTGNWRFRFTVAGRNANASDHNLTIDYIRITPVTDPSNTRPTVTNVTDKTTDQDAPAGPFNFTIGDGQTAAADLTVEAVSLNPTLLPTANITLGGSGANRTVSLSPAAGQFGSAAVLLLVSDGVNTTPETFILNVTEGPHDSLWTRETPGAHLWSEASNWQPSAIPTTGSKAALRFLDGLTLSPGTVTATNDLPGTTTLNSLALRGTGASGAASGVTLDGASISLSGTLPVVTLDANPDAASGSSLVYSVANDIALAADAEFAGNGAAEFTFGGVLSGGGNLTKSGGSRMKLTNANTYTGTTSLAGGILDVGALANGSLGAGGLRFSNSAVLQGNGVFTRTFSNAATAAVGQITGVSGGFAARGGPLTINFGGLTEPAGISLNNGGFRFGTNLVLGSPEADSPVTIVNPVSLGGFNRTITVPVGTGGDFAEISGVVSDFWGITKEGGGLLILSGDNINTGTTTINAGTLRAANDNAFGRASAAVSLNGSDAILELAEGIEINRPLTIGNDGNNKTLRLHNAAASATYAGTILINESAVSNFDISAAAGQVFMVSGKITGTAGGSLDKTGDGIVILAATDNAYTTPTRILGGTLIVTTLSDATAGGGDTSSPSSLGSTTDISWNLVISGGTLRHEAPNTTSTNRKFATGLGGSTIDSSSVSPAHTFNFTSDFAMGFNGETGPRSVTLTGSNTGSNIMRVDIDDDPSGNPTSLVKTGAGTWLLTGTNHYTGSTSVDEGTLHLGEEGQLRFRLGAASGENNRISGGGTAVINGVFSIDTTNPVAAGLTFGSWLLEDVASLTGPYGPTFTVAGFDDAGGNRWILLESARQWIFDETTGVLTLSYVGSTPYETWIESAAFNTPPLSPSEKLPGSDADLDGSPNFLEFALNGNPVDPSDNGWISPLIQDATTPAGNELTLVIAVRDGAVFTDGSATVSGVTYTVEGSLGLDFPSSAVSSTGPSDTAPAATGLPDLSGTDWEYHTFKLDASEGLAGRGFLRLKVTCP
jgi:endo-1,4-beta-xylanase